MPCENGSKAYCVRRPHAPDNNDSGLSQAIVTSSGFERWNPNLLRAARLDRGMSEAAP